jgi:hypothetical protein
VGRGSSIERNWACSYEGMWPCTSFNHSILNKLEHTRGRKIQAQAFTSFTVLSVIYQRSLDEILAFFGLDVRQVDQEQGLVDLPRTCLVRSPLVDANGTIGRRSDFAIRWVWNKPTWCRACLNAGVRFPLDRRLESPLVLPPYCHFSFQLRSPERAFARKPVGAASACQSGRFPGSV